MFALLTDYFTFFLSQLCFVLSIISFVMDVRKTIFQKIESFSPKSNLTMLGYIFMHNFVTVLKKNYKSLFCFRFLKSLINDFFW